MTKEHEFTEARNRILELNRNFASIKEIQVYIRANKAPDYLVLNGDIFTMDEYDMDGKELTYGCIKNMTQLTVTTQNRYDKRIGFSDAIVESNELDFYRNDISYFE